MVLQFAYCALLKSQSAHDKAEVFNFLYSDRCEGPNHCLILSGTGSAARYKVQSNTEIQPWALKWDPNTTPKCLLQIFMQQHICASFKFVSSWTCEQLACSKAMSGPFLVPLLQCASLTATLFASYESKYSVLSMQYAFHKYCKV